MDIRLKIFEMRSYTPIPFLIVMVAYAQPTVATLLAGFAVALLGEGIRFWGVSIAGSETRTTGAVGATNLITDGPFGHVRNPLYVGNMLMYVGICVMSNALAPYLTIGMFLWFALQYHLIVSREEEHLRTAFGEEYAVYCNNVPRFIPRVSRYQGNHSFHREADLSRGLKSEMRTLQAFGAVIVLVLLRYFLG